MNDENNISNDNQRVFIKPPILQFQNKQNNQQQEEDTTDLDEEIIEPIHQPSLEIVGTAHISDKSVESVRETIYDKKPEIVAIELDMGRYNSLIDQMNGIKREQKFDLKTILKSSNLTVTIVNALLANMQSKMGEDVGVNPGSEMIEAIKIAHEVNADIALIDRDIQVTLKRTINGMKLREKLSFVWDIILSFIFYDKDDDEEFKEEIEELKQEDTIIEVMKMFEEESPGGYNALVHERDAYMAYNLKSLEDKNVVAVIGAGHKNGILEYLENPETIPPIESISTVKESRISFGKVVIYLIPIIFILIFVVAYIQGINIEGGLLNYLIFAGGGAFIGSLLSGSKIRSALVGMVVAPVTVIHPLLAAGWFSGLVEGKLRKVGFKDLNELSKFESFKDLWHNQLFRVILVVIGTNLGCTIGVLMIINNVFVPYVHTILGF